MFYTPSYSLIFKKCYPYSFLHMIWFYESFGLPITILVYSRDIFFSILGVRYPKLTLYGCFWGNIFSYLDFLGLSSSYILTVRGYASTKLSFTMLNFFTLVESLFDSLRIPDDCFDIYLSFDYVILNGLCSFFGFKTLIGDLFTFSIYSTGKET